jgi:hypothetical protein
MPFKGVNALTSFHAFWIEVFMSLHTFRQIEVFMPLHAF